MLRIWNHGPLFYKLVAHCKPRRLCRCVTMSILTGAYLRLISFFLPYHSLPSLCFIVFSNPCYVFFALPFRFLKEGSRLFSLGFFHFRTVLSNWKCWKNGFVSVSQSQSDKLNLPALMFECICFFTSYLHPFSSTQYIWFTCPTTEWRLYLISSSSLAHQLTFLT